MNNENKLQFKDKPLKIYNPKWGSKLASTIIELEKLRVKKLGEPVPPYIFFQLKNIFQIFESLGSARIEGNNTTLAEFVEKLIEDPKKKSRDEKLIEIYNIEKAIDFIEQNVNEKTIVSRSIISDIHKILVKNLTPCPNGEGSRYPGLLRPINVSIQRSNHIPPDKTKVQDYFDELLDFINQPLETQYHLLSIVISHHRMTWIHPFDNGNGRMVRMFTYALLIKQGFQVKSGRILNPTAIFCMNRDHYYEMLALADTGSEDGVLRWCSYVLEGLQTEIEKIDNLLDLEYIVGKILLPTLDHALERENITKTEHVILTATVKSKDMTIRSSDLEKIIDQESPVQRSRILKKLRDKRMLFPIKKGGRIYTIGFDNNYLLRNVAYILEQNNFVPISLNKSK